MFMTPAGGGCGMVPTYPYRSNVGHFIDIFKNKYLAITSFIAKYSQWCLYTEYHICVVTCRWQAYRKAYLWTGYFIFFFFFLLGGEGGRGGGGKGGRGGRGGGSKAWISVHGPYKFCKLYKFRNYSRSSFWQISGLFQYYFKQQWD